MDLQTQYTEKEVPVVNYEYLLYCTLELRQRSVPQLST